MRVTRGDRVDSAQLHEQSYIASTFSISPASVRCRGTYVQAYSRSWTPLCPSRFNLLSGVRAPRRRYVRVCSRSYLKPLFSGPPPPRWYYWRVLAVNACDRWRLSRDSTEHRDGVFGFLHYGSFACFFILQLGMRRPANP